jgi:hypothetical protein
VIGAMFCKLNFSSIKSGGQIDILAETAINLFTYLLTLSPA